MNASLLHFNKQRNGEEEDVHFFSLERVFPLLLPLLQKNVFFSIKVKKYIHGLT